MKYFRFAALLYFAPFLLAACQPQQITEDEITQEPQEEQTLEAPFVYVDNGQFVEPTRVIAVDRATGEETVLVESPGEGYRYTLYAVPQLGYDGRIFLNWVIEGDNPGYDLHVLDTKTGKIARMEDLIKKLPFTSIWSTELSPDQTKLAAVYDNPSFDETSKEIVVWDLLSGESTVLGKAAEDEYLVENQSPNSFAGAGAARILWLNLDCFNVEIFEDYPEDREYVGLVEGDKKHKEYREYCLN